MEFPYWYWIKTFNTAGYSGWSSSDSGYRACTAPPSITVHPVPAVQTIQAGQSTQYSVTAAGTGLLTYQWQRDGNDIPGATNFNYVAYDAGTYRCIVSNGCGSATSNTVELHVNPTNGSIVAWGGNNYGEASPPSGAGFTAIAAGRYHCLALRADGSIAGWGWNNYGQATPPSGTGFTAIAAGYAHSLAIRADGSIVGWGDDFAGQPPSGTGFMAIAIHDYFSLALRHDGSIVAWGATSYPSP